MNHFINGQDLSPLLPKNETLSKLSNEDFRTAMDGWTEAAMKEPYVIPDIATTATGRIADKEKGEQQKEPLPKQQRFVLDLHLH